MNFTNSIEQKKASTEEYIQDTININLEHVKEKPFILGNVCIGIKSIRNPWHEKHPAESRGHPQERRIRVQ